MEWEKAKSIIIVFLIFVNILLGFLLYMSGLKYRLGPERLASITALLEESGIELKAELQKDGRPRKKMEFFQYDYDEQEMLRLFTSGTVTNKRPYDDFKMMVFVLEQETLSISRQKVIYERSPGFSEPDTPQTCEDFLKKLGERGKGYELDESYTGDDAITTVIYRQRLNGSIIYGNFISFAIENGQIRAVEYANSSLAGYLGEATEIYSSDEALFTFMTNFSDEKNSGKITITDFDMVYYSQEQSGTIIASPCYRIRHAAEDGSQSYVLINAYTNKIEYPLYL